MVTTIQINEDLKKRLNELKIHHRETYNELIERMTNEFSRSMIDKESLIETIEILSDPELMNGIKEALEEERKGVQGTPLEKVEKELGLV